MEQRHAEYVAYYKARADKYRDNRMYPHSFAAEQAMYEAIANAESLEAFRDIQEEQQLAFKCALGRVKDVEAAKAALYRELDEEVRAGLHEAVLAAIDEQAPTNVEDLNTLVTDIHTKWHLKISEDEYWRPEFWGDFKVIEDLEETVQSEVPPEWHQGRREFYDYELKRAREHFNDVTIPEARKFFPEWEPDWEALWKPRHRRHFPVPDEVVENRMKWHQHLLKGGE